MNQPLAQALVILGVVLVLLICFQSGIQKIWSRILNRRRTDGEDAGDRPGGEGDEADGFGPFGNPFPDEPEAPAPSGHPEDEVMNLSAYRVGDEFAADEAGGPAEPGLSVDAVMDGQDEGWVPPVLDRVYDDPESVPEHDKNPDREPAASLPYEDDDMDNPPPPPPPESDPQKSSGMSRIADTVRSLFGPSGRGKPSTVADREQVRESLSGSLGADDAGTDGQAGPFESKRVRPQMDLFDDLPEAPAEEYPETERSEEPSAAEAPRPGEFPDPEDDERFDYPGIEGFAMLSQIDYWAKISGGLDVACQKVMPFYKLAAPMIPELTQIHGLCQPDNEWRDLEKEPGATPVRDIVITIQLANMNTTVSQSSMEKYVSLNKRIAKVTGKDLTFMASPQNAMRQAKCIFAFARTYQPVYSITVVPEKTEGFHGEEIHKFASQRGLHPVDPGFYVRHKTIGKNKVTLYSLVNMTESGAFDLSNLREELTRGVVFYSLPILHNSPGAVFSEMADSARAFASRFRAQAMSPDAAPLTQEESDRCRRQIESRTRRIEALGIMSGSDEAVRIFRTDAH